MSPEAVVYLGPSLSRAEAAQLLEADYRAPIKRGDLAKLLPSPPRFVGIIDGEFYQNLAVSPKEILPLLDAGATILGAGSMGALRAAETYPYGMIGVGRIFHLYREHRIDGDDEVAVTYCPESYRTFSEPLVNLRIALAEARRLGTLSPEHSSHLIRRMKGTYFPERTLERFWREAKSILPAEGLEALRQFFLERKPDAKADDTRALLREISRRAYDRAGTA